EDGIATALSVHAVLPRWKRYVSTTTPAFPEHEADEFEPVERAALKVEFGISELAGWSAFVIGSEFYGHWGIPPLGCQITLAIATSTYGTDSRLDTTSAPTASATDDG